MAHTAFADAAKLINQLEKQLNLSVVMKDRTRILKQELRFLSTFLKYTANRCTDYKNLPDLFASVKDLELIMENLLLVLPPRWEELPSILSDAAADVLDKIQLVKPEIRQVQFKVLTLSGSGCRMIDELVLEFLDTLLEDLRELLGYEADLIQPSLGEGIEVLERKLTSLKGLLSFTAKRSEEHDKLDQLFAHVQAVADNAAYLAYSCLTRKMDEDMACRLALQISDLVQKIDPVKLEVREIYIGVLEASRSSESKSDTDEMDETLVDFVDSLLESLRSLLYRDIMAVKDHIEDLQLELIRLKYFLKDAERFTKPGKSADLLAQMEVMVINAGSVIYSLFEDEVIQEIGKQARLALAKLLNTFKLVREIYASIVKARISHLPRSDVLGSLDLLLWDLKELLNESADSITLLKDHIQIAQRDLGSLRSFLTTIIEQHHKHEKLEDLWRRIIHVMYELEYIIGLVTTKDGPVLHHKSWISDLTQEIKLIKKEISEIQNSDKNISGLQEHDVTNICSGPALSQESAFRINEEMVGFKDEENKVVEQLVSGSMLLQIVSIVGMPGLGKTFLAQKIYNNPIIRDQFYVHAWYSISQVYERKELLSNILSQVNKSAKEMSYKTDEELAGELHKCLKGQKYLIILDDIWDIKAWEALRRSFPDDNNGSRIVFTSRFPELALQAKSDSKIHRLRSFSHSESWELLIKKVFQIESCPLELLEVGQQIAKHCNGLPLAVVVVAGLLGRMVKELDRWRKVADSLSSFIINDPQRLCMDILDLSYKNLPDYLKPCFLYLGGFPQDREISVSKLAQLWIAEGFVRDDDPNLEHIAEGYLMDLIGKSLIIASKERSTGGVQACVLHDLVREFCSAKAKEENFLKLIKWRGELTTWSFSESDMPASYSTSYEQRRIFVHCRQFATDVLVDCARPETNCFEYVGPCVRSLLLFAPWTRIDELFSSIIPGFKFLRVLYMMHINIGNTFPEGIESLASLRYLAVSGKFMFLPRLITKLRNLETLIVKGTVDYVSPYAIFNLTKLRHLHIHLPKQLHRHIHSFRFSHVSSFGGSFQLDSLQTLSSPFLPHGNDMEIIRRFPNLKKLSCVLKESWDSTRKCDRFPVLDFLNKLESLKVSCQDRMWRSLDEMWHPCELSLPLSIKKLTMSKLQLQWKEISVIGKLPNLEVLKLLTKSFEGAEWNMQDGEFPKLRVLKLSHLNLRRWIASGDYFPPLERLTLECCFVLEEIPSCLEDIPTLNIIRVHHCNASLEAPIKRIQEEQGEMGNEELKIEIRRWE